MDTTIRYEIPGDIAGIHSLIELAFRNAPHTDHTEQYIVQALRAAGVLWASLVAESGGKLVGHLALSPVQISDGSSGWYGLGPIAVHPDYQGKAVGSRLMQRALAELEARGAAGCVVLGDPGYYGRFGFKAQSRLVLPGVPPEYFQARSFRGACPRGSVQYQLAFNARG
ncbi:GCN5 family acetyltransferase [Marinobacterium aestuarii]|uniref:GCN5 family acetyltransferase n=1 Tax=Marinobacterium aestuarii TaxID=1821621 RepID=A0A1A9F010_9GAMM|nr:N-acetyltransferase [Marinobacterium aestuarii]ANG63495.1 GCN5 family acetyltransferase [Marinobacterium aestuarii]